MRSYALDPNELVYSRDVKGCISDFVLSGLYLGRVKNDDRIFIRPVLEYDEIDSNMNNVIIDKKRQFTGEILYGEYPQSVAMESQNLTMLFANNKLDLTGKVYHMLNAKKELVAVPEYFYNGKKYVNYIIDNNYKTRLSNKKRYSYNEMVWFEVEPIKWIMSDELDIAICKNFIIKDSDSKTFMNTNYVENYFFNDIVPSDIKNIKKYVK